MKPYSWAKLSCVIMNSSCRRLALKLHSTGAQVTRILTSPQAIFKPKTVLAVVSCMRPQPQTLIDLPFSAMCCQKGDCGEPPKSLDLNQAGTCRTDEVIRKVKRDIWTDRDLGINQWSPLETFRLGGVAKCKSSAMAFQARNQTLLRSRGSFNSLPCCVIPVA